jgi:SAM-dependent methyltransferase/GT2 family glycosyltransferase
VTYVAEPRPGLSAARNAALAATGAALLAFVDDDVVVEPGWLGWLCAPFADPAVGAVCGLVLPAALDTEAQLAFETVLGGLGRGFVPRRADRALLDGRLRAAPVWDLGAGANMAVRRAALDAVGAFDERLGAGAAGCSEDSELWHRLLAAGWAVVYEPASVVEHEHRRTWPELERQAHAYLRGHVAALFVQFARTRHPGELVRAFARLPAFLARVAVVEASAAALARLRLAIREAPPRPVAAELRGYARGLAHLPLALAPPRSPYKAPLGAFLRRNPFPHPLTEGFFYREKMRAIHRITPDAPIARVLEVGGGRSGMGHRLFPRARITNTDLDPSHATAPENQHERVTFQPADATALPFADASFDAVTMFDLLEHVPDDRAAAAEAMRVVRPGGWVLVSTPNLRWRSPYHRWMRRISPTTEEMMAQWEHVRLGYDRAALEALFGRPPETTAEFITPVTVVGHDVAFSRLPGKVRRAVLVALAPVIWAGYWLQGRHGEGTETAAAFRRPPA